MIVLSSFVGTGATFPPVAVLRVYRELGLHLTHTHHEVYYEHLLRALSTRALRVDFRGFHIQDKRSLKLSDRTLADWLAAELVQKAWRLNRERIKVHSSNKARVLQSQVASHDQSLLQEVVYLIEKQQIATDVHSSRRLDSAASLSHWDSMHRSLMPNSMTRHPIFIEDIFADSDLLQLFSSVARSTGDPAENVEFVVQVEFLEKVRASSVLYRSFSEILFCRTGTPTPCLCSNRHNLFTTPISNKGESLFQILSMSMFVRT